MTLLTQTVDLTLADASTLTCPAWWEPAKTMQFGVGDAQLASALNVYVDGTYPSVVAVSVGGIAHQVTETPQLWPAGKLLPDQTVISCSALLTDDCTIARRTGSTLDPSTGRATGVWTTVWTGKCRIVSTPPRPVTAGGESVSVADPDVLLPLAAPAPLVGYRITTPAATLYVSGVVTGTSLALRRVTATTGTAADR